MFIQNLPSRTTPLRDHWTRLCAAALVLLSTSALAQAPLNGLPEYSDETHIAFNSFSSAPADQCGTRCGKSLAMDGDLLVLGASYFIRSSSLPGPTGARYPIVLEYQNGDWIKVANLQTWVDNVFVSTQWTSAATAVAVEGDVVVLGDPDENGPGVGAVRVFVKPPGGWPGPIDITRLRPVAILTAGGRRDRLGTSVAILNGTIVAGAPDAELFGIGSIPEHGAVYIWEEPSGGWGAIGQTPGMPAARQPDHLVAPSDFGGNRMGERIAVAEIDGRDEIVVADEHADELFLLRRNGLTWRFDRLQADLGAPAPFDTVNQLVYDGTTLLVGYEEQPFFHVAEREDEDPMVPWHVARLAREPCQASQPGCSSNDFTAMGRGLALVPGGILAGDPLMTSDGQVLSGGLFRFLRPDSGWTDVTLPWSAHFTPVYPTGFELPRALQRWAETIVYDNGRLAVNIPLRPGIGFEDPSEVVRAGISLYEDAAVVSASGRATDRIGSTPPPEPAKKLYLSKNEFCADTQATHATGNAAGGCFQGDDARLPNTVMSGSDITLGQLRLTSVPITNTIFTGQSFTSALPGSDIRISNSEEFDIETIPVGSDIYSIGFTIWEDFEGNSGEPGLRDDSLFIVRLFKGQHFVHQFEFNPMNRRADFGQDTAVFIGVWSDEPFDRIELREAEYFGTQGTSDNDLPGFTEEPEDEYFGPFFTGTLPRDIGEAQVGFTPSTLDFGDQVISTDGESLVMQLENIGDGTLSIDSIAAVSSPFTRENDTCGDPPKFLAPGESCELQYRFDPDVIGAVLEHVSVLTNSPDSPDTLTLTGHGISPSLSISPNHLEFGDVPISSPSTPVTVLIESNGLTDLCIGSIAIVGPHASDFERSIAFDNCSGATLVPSSDCTVEFTFTPSAAGVRTASAIVSTNTAEGTASIALRGTNNVVFFDGFE